MNIYNSTEELIKYVAGQQFADIYADSAFPVKFTSTVPLKGRAALEYLLGSASVGNKVIGFFNRLPAANYLKPLRGACVFVTTELPSSFDIPLFFARTPAHLVEMFPRVIKLSAEMGMPVQLIVADNALYNYSESAYPATDLDIGKPYLQADSFDNRWDVPTRLRKLTTEYNRIAGALPISHLPPKIAFNNPHEEFPLYIFPVACEQQKEAFRGLTELSVPKGAEAHLLHYFLNTLLKLDVAIKDDVEEEEAQSQIFLCPGCPFPAILKLPVEVYTLFSSLGCAAIYKLYNIHRVSLTEFLGLTSKKLNLPVLYIGNISELPAGLQLPQEPLFIFLQDTESARDFYRAKYPHKLKADRVNIFPYSCDNIKRYGAVKLKKKRCKCGSLVDGGEGYSCITYSKCPLIYKDEHVVEISTAECTGCRNCAVACDYKAL